jgi:PEP-CTERM motif
MDNVAYNSTPEPGTLALLGSGMLAGLGVLRRKILL